jgi:hypothetical protein
MAESRALSPPPFPTRPPSQGVYHRFPRSFSEFAAPERANSQLSPLATMAEARVGMEDLRDARPEGGELCLAFQPVSQLPGE